MIKRVYRSKFDIENLSRLRTSIPSEIDTFDYKGVIVNKPWGYEYLLFENLHVAVWILHLKQNCSTSMHCHPNKRTSLTVLFGNVHCSTLDGWIESKEGEGLIIDEAVFHSTKAVSKEGAFIMEIESPPNKKDLVRLKDEYGRERQGYEGSEKMSKDFNKYEYIDFHKGNFAKKCIKTIKNCSISIRFHSNPKDIHERLMQEEGQIVCILRGKLHDMRGNIVLSCGEAGVLSDILSKTKTVTFGDIMYLTIHHKKK